MPFPAPHSSTQVRRRPAGHTADGRRDMHASVFLLGSSPRTWRTRADPGSGTHLQRNQATTAVHASVACSSCLPTSLLRGSFWLVACRRVCRTCRPPRARPRRGPRPNVQTLARTTGPMVQGGGRRARRRLGRGKVRGTPLLDGHLDGGKRSQAKTRGTRTLPRTSSQPRLQPKQPPPQNMGLLPLNNSRGRAEARCQGSTAGCQELPADKTPGWSRYPTVARAAGRDSGD